MKQYEGISVSPGLAMGKAFVVFPTSAYTVPQYKIEPALVANEIERLETAVNQSCVELESLKQRLSRRLKGAEINIVDVHVTMLQDPVFLENVRVRVIRDGVNVDQAVAEEIETMVAQLEASRSEYLRERSTDVRDMGKRLLRNLSLIIEDTARPRIDFPEQTILVARELLPTHTLELDRSRIVGIVTEQGGPSSHAAILARALGIPSVSGILQAVLQLPHGSNLLVNGNTGQIVLDPTTSDVNRFNADRKKHDQLARSLLAEEHEPCITCDGTEVGLWGNIGDSIEASAIKEHRLAGVGLLRSEFMFLSAVSPPTLEDHFRKYTEIFGALERKPITIRTLDLRADKAPKFITEPDEVIPRQNLRGLRLSLAVPRLLRTQLRAILRASRDGAVRILFPMVTSADDLERAMTHVHWAMDKEGVRDRPPVGAMIETPSAIFELEEIMKLADFVSIGTNDLTQYMLAIDRQEADMQGYNSVLYPGVLKALIKILDLARATACELSICGEAAGNPSIACLFVGMGFRSLSMSPIRAAHVRHAIRSTSLSQLEQLASSALNHRSVEQTRRLLDDHRKRIWKVR